jgi:PAS domain S-box-containing protein
LLDEGQVVGVLNVESTHGVQLTAADLRLMVGLGEHVSVAIRRARLYAEVQKKEEQYRSLFENVPVGIGVVDQSGKFVAFNEAILIPGGYSREDIIGLGSVEELYYEAEDRKKILSVLESQRRLVKYPVQFKRKDGSPYDTLLTLTPVEFEGQQCIQALVEDISEQKKAEESLKASEKRFRTLIENSYEGITVLDGEGKIIYYSPSNERITGFTSQERTGQTGLALVHPDDLEKITSGLREMAQKPFAINTGVYRIRHKDGSWHWIEAAARNLLADPDVKGIVINTRDVTARKEAEKVLRDNEARFRGLSEAPFEGIMIHDRGIILDANQAFADLFGYQSPQELIGRNGLQVLSLAPESLDLIKENIRTSAPEAFDVTVIRADGSTFQAETRGRDIIFQDRKVRVVSMHDITERKRAEQKLQRQLIELTVLHAVSVASTQSNSEDEIIEVVTNLIARLYPEVCGVLLLNELGDILTPHPSYRGADVSGWQNGYPISRGVTGRSASTGKLIRLDHVAEDENYIQIAAGVQSELCVPIRVSELVIGILNVESRKENAFDQEDEQILNTIAGGLGTAIQRLRSFKAEQKRRQEAEKLRQAATAVTSSLNLKEVLFLLLDTLKGVVPYDRASIFMPEGDAVRIVAAQGIRDEEGLNRLFPADNQLFQEIRRSGQPVMLEDAQSDPRFEKWILADRVHGWLGIPMITRGQITGYITLDSYTRGVYDRESVEMAQVFAHQAASAIENSQLFEKLQDAYDSTLEGWGNALELRDKETQGHTRRVTELTLELAKTMGCTDEILVQIRRGVLVHDIGKMGVPDHILRKAGPLTKKEWEEMRKHTQYGFDLLHPIEYLRPALDIAYYHHEWWDGTGYPAGLKGDQIPMSARMFAVVDVWDALLSDRPYRKAWPRKKVIEHIRAEAGTHFDPDIVEIYLAMMESRFAGPHRK